MCSQEPNGRHKGIQIQSREESLNRSSRADFKNKKHHEVKTESQENKRVIRIRTSRSNDWTWAITLRQLYGQSLSKIWGIWYLKHLEAIISNLSTPEKLVERKTNYQTKLNQNSYLEIMKMESIKAQSLLSSEIW